MMADSFKTMPAIGSVTGIGSRWASDSTFMPNFSLRVRPASAASDVMDSRNGSLLISGLGTKTINRIVIKGASSSERLLDEVTLFLHSVEASLPANVDPLDSHLEDEEERARLTHAVARGFDQLLDVGDAGPQLDARRSGIAGDDALGELAATQELRVGGGDPRCEQLGTEDDGGGKRSDWF